METSVFFCEYHKQDISFWIYRYCYFERFQRDIDICMLTLPRLTSCSKSTENWTSKTINEITTRNPTQPRSVFPCLLSSREDRMTVPGRREVCCRHDVQDRVLIGEKEANNKMFEE